MPLRDFWQHLSQFFANLLYPPQCGNCGRYGYLLCPSCRAQIQPLPAPFCFHCHTPLSSSHCPSCSFHKLQISQLRVCSTYEDPLRNLIHQLKYRNHVRLAQPLAEIMLSTYQSQALKADLISCVPLHPSRLYERGYNQAHLLAEKLAQYTNLPYDPYLLERIRNTPAQARLQAQERRLNVKGAFQPGPSCVPISISQRNILIVDDVCTTGSTLEACAVPLLRAGAGSVNALVLARPGWR